MKAAADRRARCEESWRRRRRAASAGIAALTPIMALELAAALRAVAYPPVVSPMQPSRESCQVLVRG